MDRGFRPKRLEVLPNSPEAQRIFKHLFFVLTKFKNSVEDTYDVYLGFLANSLSQKIF